MFYHTHIQSKGNFNYLLQSFPPFPIKQQTASSQIVPRKRIQFFRWYRTRDAMIFFMLLILFLQGDGVLMLFLLLKLRGKEPGCVCCMESRMVLNISSS